MRTRKTVEIFALTILLMSIEGINTIDTQEQENKERASGATAAA